MKKSSILGINLKIFKIQPLLYPLYFFIKLKFSINLFVCENLSHNFSVQYFLFYKKQIPLGFSYIV